MEKGPHCLLGVCNSFSKYLHTKEKEKLLFIEYVDLKAWDLLVFVVQAVMHLADSLINATVR